MSPRPEHIPQEWFEEFEAAARRPLLRLRAFQRLLDGEADRPTISYALELLKVGAPTS